MTLHKRLVTAGAGLVVALAATACGDGITDQNRNPNSPEDVPATTLFTSAARLSASRWLGVAYNLRAMEFVSQHQAEAQYPDEDRYARITSGTTRTWFDAPYYSELEDLQRVIQKGRAADEAGTYAPALVMRTYDFAFMTDTWGDIPYSEALQGDSGVISPKYDPQSEIYADLFAVLDEAATSLQGADNTLGAADPVYGGDPVAWQKLANSLRLRYAIRVVNVDPAMADAQIRAALAAPGGVFTSNADNATIDWPGDGVYNNPWADQLKTRDDNRVSKTLMDIMNARNDPRRAILAQPTDADPTVYAGLQNALTHAGASSQLSTTSRPGAIFYPGQTAYGFFGGQGGSQPSFIMTYAEVQFILAEAAERGLGGLSAGQAAGFYNEGVLASMEQWGVSAAAAAAYLAQPSIAYAGGVNGLVQIAVQKWIALFSDGGTAWSEWRRTCRPATIVPGPSATRDNVPRRLMYSPTEYSVNVTNLELAIANQGDDVFETRMWWDSNPTAAPTYVAGCGNRTTAPTTP